jgi:4-hydroxybenzoate polyprenyltransferase
MSNSRHDPRNRQRPIAPRKKSVYLGRRIIALVVLVALVAAYYCGDSLHLPPHFYLSFYLELI